MDRYIYTKEQYPRQFVVGRDAFLELNDAIAAAYAARDKKIASLKKQIAKLEKLRFEP
jgi:hypothetical protein